MPILVSSKMIKKIVVFTIISLLLHREKDCLTTQNVYL